MDSSSSPELTQVRPPAASGNEAASEPVPMTTNSQVHAKPIVTLYIRTAHLLLKILTFGIMDFFIGQLAAQKKAARHKFLEDEWNLMAAFNFFLIPGLLTWLQVDGTASDPVSKTATLCSLSCALSSLIHAILNKYGPLKNKKVMSEPGATRTSSELEAGEGPGKVSVKVAIVLVTPIAWLIWSLLGFTVALLTYVWRTGSSSDPDEREPLDPTAILGPRIVVTFLLLFGAASLWINLLITKGVPNVSLGVEGAGMHRS